MGKRRENMLEAFKASHDQTVRNRQVAEAVEAARLVRSGGQAGGAAEQESLPADAGLPNVAPGGPRRGGGADAELHEALGSTAESAPLPATGPVAAPAGVLPVREPLGAGPAADSAQPELGGVTLPMGLAPFLALQLLILGVAFGLGWIASGADRGALGTNGDALAAGAGGLLLDTPGTGDAASAGLNSPLRGGRSPAALDAVLSSEAAEGQAQAAGEAQVDPASTPADQAFDNPASRFTVVVAQYNDTTYGRARAWEAYEFLTSQGLPVVSPRARNRVVFLFVGASADRSELDPLLKQVRGQAGASGRETPFYDAYVSNISRYL